jgi:predicted nucleotidyltransferase
MVMTQDIMSITEAIKKAVPTEKIYLFGSYAYGTPTENSDYDFFLVIPDDGMRPLIAMQEAQKALMPMRLSRELRKSVDVSANTVSKFEEYKNSIGSVIKEVAQKGVLIYERDSSAVAG